MSKTYLAMPPQVQGESAERNEDGLKKVEEAQKPGKHGPRKRVSQACDRCRSRKDKCDGKKPACSTCITNGRSCSYDANVKKRGLPEGYVRGLEKLWGIAIKEVTTVEDSILTALAGSEDNESVLNVWNDENNSESWVETWRKSQMSRELERLLSSQEPSNETMKRKRIDTDGQSTKRLETSTGYQNGSQWQEVSAGMQNDLHKPQSPARLSSAIDDFLIKEYESILSPSTAHGVSSGTPAATTIDLPELPSETWHLLDVYFSYTHSWLPIIEKHDLLRTSYQYSQNRSTGSTSASGENAVLWAAIAYAKVQHRAINNIPRALGNVGEMVWTAERMYSQARALIPNEEGNLELGHVQALLILTLSNMGMGHYSRAWSLIGQAVRLALDLQLDHPVEFSSNSARSRSRSKHVFLGCFVLDTLISARLKRKPHLRSDDMDAVGLVEEDGLEEWDPWTDCLNVRRGTSSRVPASILSTFNQLIQLLKSLNDAACVSSGANHLQASTALQDKLHLWSRSQPGSLFDLLSNNGEPTTLLLPHQNHLYNIYFTTLAASQLLPRGNEYEAVDLEPCTRSVKHVVGLINQHSNSFGLLIVPPTYEYFVKTAYDVVHTVQSSIESTHIILNDWKRSLDHCLDAMESAWPVFETFKSSITYQATSGPRRHSQVAFDLISGISQDSETPMSGGGKTPQSITSHETLSSHSPQLFRTMARPETASTSRTNLTAQSMKAQQAPRSSSFGQSSGHGLPQNPLNLYENAFAPYQNKRPSFGTEKSPSTIASLRPQPSFNIAPPNNPQLHRSLTISSADVEFDPMFNELMRLDATEWSGNWDQSLMNLGFTESDNMNQDFYAFCQEPDPLHQNNVFQQLVANSNAETTDFFDGSGDIFGGMGIAGGFVGGLGMGVAVADENEGIEAGQILQALSAAEEQRSIGRAGG